MQAVLSQYRHLEVCLVDVSMAIQQESQHLDIQLAQEEMFLLIMLDQEVVYSLLVLLVLAFPNKQPALLTQGFLPVVLHISIT